MNLIERRIVSLYCFPFRIYILSSLLLLRRVREDLKFVVTLNSFQGLSFAFFFPTSDQISIIKTINIFQFMIYCFRSTIMGLSICFKRRMEKMKSITTLVEKKVLRHSKRAFGFFTLTLLLFASFIILNQNAQAQLFCPSGAIEQITEFTAGDSSRSSIDADGTRIAFQSNADINGGNPDGNNEIYLLDRATGIFTQITFTVVGSNDFAAINADGTRIAFQSDANINGGNPELNREMYIFDTTTAIFTQITFTMGGTIISRHH
jgi:hypothetical protein